MDLPQTGATLVTTPELRARAETIWRRSERRRPIPIVGDVIEIRRDDHTYLAVTDLYGLWLAVFMVADDGRSPTLRLVQNWRP